MKIITLNLNGIRAASRKGFFEWLQKEQPDYICLQELKAHEIDLTSEMMNPKGYFGYFSFAQKKVTAVWVFILKRNLKKSSATRV